MVHEYVLLLCTLQGIVPGTTGSQLAPPSPENSSVTPPATSPAAAQVTVCSDPRFHAVLSFGFVIRIPAIVYELSDMSCAAMLFSGVICSLAAGEISSGISFGVTHA